jgi:hypothetical protein
MYTGSNSTNVNDEIHNNVFLPTPYGVRENCIGQTDGHISKLIAFGRAIVKVLVYMYKYVYIYKNLNMVEDIYTHFHKYVYVNIYLYIQI